MKTILSQTNNPINNESTGNREKKVWARPELTLIDTPQGGTAPALIEASTTGIGGPAAKHGSVS